MGLRKLNDRAYKTALISTLAFVAVAAVIGGLESCKKTDSPLGVYAPLGLDRPTYTPTPTTGSFNIYVVDGAIAQTGVSCFLVDPTGSVTYTASTQAAPPNNAPFPISNVTNGIWTAGVYTQGIYYLSTVPITITGNAGQNVIFSAPTQSVSIWNTNGTEKYNYGGGIFTYGVTYIQPGNLNEPVSLFISPTNAFPNNWAVTFSNPVLGGTAKVGSLTITVPCAIVQPSFNVKATKFNGVLLNSANHQITRNYLVGISVVLATTTTMNTADNTSITTGSASFNGNQDCNEIWQVYIDGSFYGNLITGSGWSVYESGGGISCQPQAVSIYCPSVGVSASGSGCNGQIINKTF